MTSPPSRVRQRLQSLLASRARAIEGGDQSEFVAPNNALWQLDRSHHSGGTTLIAQRLMSRGIELGGSEMFRSLGIPIQGMQPAYVHGFLYVQMRSTLGSFTPGWLPPPRVIRRVFAASPLGRRCESTARRALAERPWEQALEEWPARAQQLIKANKRWQSFDLDGAGEAELVAHTVALFAYCQDGFIEHFKLHGVDLVPIGMLLSQGGKWGIGRDELLATLTGASGATEVPQRALDLIADSFHDEVGDRFDGVASMSLDEIRGISPNIATAIDSFLERYGSTVVEGYDIDGRTLAELPDLIAQRILGPSSCTSSDRATAYLASAVDLGLTDSQYEHFQSLVKEARRAVAVREEQGPLTIQWPVGLLRNALLEIGRRRVRAQRWSDERLALELAVEEFATLGSPGEPSRDELLRRRSLRRAQREMIPPATLGSAAPFEPKPEWFSPAVAQMVDLLLVTTVELGIRTVPDTTVEAAVESRGSDHQVRSARSPTGPRMLSGAGIGTAVVTGIARVATNEIEAIDYAQPGEILVTHHTSPAYNLVLGQVGGLITTSNGAMSHAAVLARELGFTAIVGVTNATRVLQSGDRVRLDPSVGTVELLSASDESP